MAWWNRDPIEEELAEHFEQLKQERLQAGDSETEAIEFARRRLGKSSLRDEIRDLSGRDRADALLRHLSFALRSFAHHRGAYVLATAILALGIGLSVSMFSMVQAVVRSPLPFPEQDQLHLIWKSDKQILHAQVGELAYPELADLQQLKEIEAVALIPAALYGNGRVLQAAGGEPIAIETCPASPDFFRVLGVKPLLGRDFEPSDQHPGAARVVILSAAVWRDHFGSRRDVIGEVVRLNQVGHRVIGVMAPEVNFPRGAGLWVPLATSADRGMTWLQAVARARHGITQERLAGAVERLFSEQYSMYSQEYSRTQGGVVTPIKEFLLGSSEAQLLVSLAASLLLLVSACVSAGNLFLSRAIVRRRELATRVSLGASSGQILTQLGVESSTCAALALMTGTALAYAAIHLLIRWAPADIPRIEDATLDPAALGFALVAAFAAAAACLVGPASLLYSGSLDSLLREGGARSTGARTVRRLQGAFLTVQSALTVAILAAGLLLFVSYGAVIRTDLGFAHRDTLTMNLAFYGPQVDPPKRRTYYQNLLDRLRASPEVTSAAAVLLRPMEGPIGWDTEYSFEFEAGMRDPHQLTKANFEVVTPGYFETMGTPLLEGRDFTERDTEREPLVVIISRSLAARIRAAGHEPLGQRLHTFGALRKVVGVAANARYRRIVQPLDDVYVPYRQVDTPTNYLVVRGRVTPGELLLLVRRTLREIAPGYAIAGEATLGQMVERHTSRDRFNLLLMMFFAAGAVVLAAAGIHSLVAESVAAREKELAIKSALGARRGLLAAEAVRPALLFASLGVIVGLAVALAIGHAAADLLYEVAPQDPFILGAVSFLVLAMAAVSSWTPAWLAAGRDPRPALQLD
jgi:putative ABC transport system permease protein